MSGRNGKGQSDNEKETGEQCGPALTAQHFSSKTFYICFLFFKTKFLSVDQTGLEFRDLPVDQAGLKFGDLPAFASPVLKLKACTTIPWHRYNFYITLSLLNYKIPICNNTK